MYPRLEININKLKTNLQVISNLLKKNNLSLAMVTKAYCANINIVTELVKDNNLVDYLADSRIENLKKMKDINIPKILLRIPMKSEVEEVVKYSNNAKLSSNWILTEVLRVLKHKNIDIDKFTISSENLAKIIKLIDKNTISSKIAKEVFEIALDDTRDPEIIVKEKGLVQLSDTSEIEKMVDEVLANNQKMVEDYKAADEGRKPRILKGIIGQVMKISKGKANPEIVNELIMEKLK